MVYITIYICGIINYSISSLVFYQKKKKKKEGRCMSDSVNIVWLIDSTANILIFLNYPKQSAGPIRLPAFKYNFLIEIIVSYFISFQVQVLD